MYGEVEPEQALFATADGGQAHPGAGRGKEVCGLCGNVRNPDAESEEDPDDLGNEWSYSIRIGKVQVLDCCFHKIEVLFVTLATMPNAMRWLSERLNERARRQQDLADVERERAEAAATLEALLEGRMTLS